MYSAQNNQKKFKIYLFLRKYIGINTNMANAIYIQVATRSHLEYQTRPIELLPCHLVCDHLQATKQSIVTNVRDQVVDAFCVVFILLGKCSNIGFSNAGRGGAEKWPASIERGLYPFISGGIILGALYEVGKNKKYV